MPFLLRSGFILRGCMAIDIYWYEFRNEAAKVNGGLAGTSSRFSRSPRRERSAGVSLLSLSTLFPKKRLRESLYHSYCAF